MKTLAEIKKGLRFFGWKIESIKQRNGRWTLTLKTCGNKLLIISDSREEVWDKAFGIAFKATREGWVHIEW